MLYETSKATKMEQSVKVKKSRKVFVRGYFDSDLSDATEMVMYFLNLFNPIAIQLLVFSMLLYHLL